ncbi:hypothetical protein EVAR_23198_1 [Eumeta japonica]|uniref:Uncharacterized protein n=1 Tax=Eumeta variegata TaxID=151549 RepID=A0A4C1VDK6_EUMVA|nr:hypothetical protein EVAR_23198_1 [Eumeta japonica]
MFQRSYDARCGRRGGGAIHALIEVVIAEVTQNRYLLQCPLFTLHNSATALTPYGRLVFILGRLEWGALGLRGRAPPPARVRQRVHVPAAR